MVGEEGSGHAGSSGKKTEKKTSEARSMRVLAGKLRVVVIHSGHRSNMVQQPQTTKLHQSSSYSSSIVSLRVTQAHSSRALGVLSYYRIQH